MGLAALVFFVLGMALIAIAIWLFVPDLVIAGLVLIGGAAMFGAAKFLSLFYPGET